MVINRNLFVESVFPHAILRDLPEEDMAAYREPFKEPGEGRRPTLSWPRQLPINGEPSDIVKIVEGYGAWLLASSVPKLFINADPGVLLTGRAREFCRSWPNQREITVPGLHFIPEDSPAEIGTAIADFVRAVRAADGK
jgi:haloalkane dehalogenase